MKATPSSPLIGADVLIKGLVMPFDGLNGGNKKGEPVTYLTSSYKEDGFFVSSEYVRRNDSTTLHLHHNPNPNPNPNSNTNPKFVVIVSS